ncbi:uncharacterized protein PHALS_14844 [Plasmopara halstedii]|uniref:Uncharacterized protein n=1 Tax=Plasmopara halstedii TaxID=4781 RepID=A0A0P1A7Q5_PLAHL|nr:uncharacterized protein PHALS_14844 [Plasmopara halstedii]CEG36260.1 hypothetical protein PHALS_14844 [Plasmopara halstedii]|eukprot:XP_024572629.1 hypothetical protein PHALS_14844 [Plasmopara halstedii]
MTHEVLSCLYFLTVLQSIWVVKLELIRSYHSWQMFDIAPELISSVDRFKFEGGDSHRKATSCR